MPSQAVAASAPREPKRAPGPQIAYVINSLEGGGAAAPLPDIVRVLQQAGARVRVYALSRRNGLAIGRLEAGGVDWQVSPAKAKAHVSAAAWLMQALRRDRPDLIWTSLTQATLIGQMVGRALAVPVVSWQHNAFLKPANLALLRATRRLTHLWVADSAAVAELTVRRLGVAPARVKLWPLFCAAPDQPVSEAWRPGETFRFGSLGRLHPNKGYDVLIEAVARLESARASHWPQFSVDVLGEGPSRAMLEILAARLGVTSIRLGGFQARPTFELARWHAYLQPSRAEGLCIAAHEAMLAGLPIIASRVGEMPRTIDDSRAGEVIAPEDPTSLARAMAALLDDPAGARAAGLRGRALVLDRFSHAAFTAAGHAALDGALDALPRR